MSDQPTGIGKACYEAWRGEEFCQAAEWDGLPPADQVCWVRASQAAIKAHLEIFGPDALNRFQASKLKNDIRLTLADFKSRIEEIIWQFEYGGKK